MTEHLARGDLLDVVLAALCVLYALNGFRRGLLVAVLSFAGFIGGAILGAHYSSSIVHAFVSGSASGSDVGPRLAAMLVVIVVAILGETVGALIGGRLRGIIAFTPLRLVDAAGGAVLGAISVLLVAWLLASALATAPFPSLVRQIRRSAILGATDSVLPRPSALGFADLLRLLQQHGLPPIANPFEALPVPPQFVAPPNDAVIAGAMRVARASIVKVRGTAPSCSRDLEGSGFVYAPQHVLTNAHVVAGVTRDLTVAAPGGQVLAARVVLYDPNRDVAILYVPGLSVAALSFHGAVGTGTDAVVAGYPENGPLTAVAARVASRGPFTGPNIYQNRQVTRDVYTLRASVLPGNSGGPLLAPNGQVDGVVFAASTDTSDVGYALTAAEVSPDAGAGAGDRAGVSTEGCD